MPASNFFKQTIAWSKWNGQSAYGVESFDDAVNVKCKFIEKTMIDYKRLQQQTDESVYDAKMYVPISSDISEGDKVVYEGKTYQVSELMAQRGTVTTLKHKRLMLKKKV